MRSRNLIGKEVVGARGWKIGKVKELIFDEGTWKIVSVEVELERRVAEEYRMKRLLSRTDVKLAVESVRAVGDHVILSVTKPELRRMVASQSEIREDAAPSGSPPLPQPARRQS